MRLAKFDRSQLRDWWKWLIYCSLVAGLASVTPAVDGLGLFELEGNAVDEAAAGDDWDGLPGASFVFTGIGADPAPNSIFDGGKKDIQDISQWSGGNGSVPDKNDITNAYASAYKCPGTGIPAGCTPGPGGDCECDPEDLIVFFGADRISNNGDAFLGFWFFKDSVEFDEASGDFSCSDADGDGECHVPGDTLVLVNFPQATNAEPEIRVVGWDPTCSKADSNAPAPGDCAAKNLRLIADGAVCGEVADDDACAITNAATEDAPWPFQSKNPDPAAPTDFPLESFFEGGINLSRVVGGDACFASFMAETRSSSSFTAALKDFVLDDFPVCAVELSKECGAGQYNPETGNLEIPYEVTVENAGSGSVQEILATDDDCGFGGGTTLNFGPLAAGESGTQGGTCIVPEGFTPPIINGVSAIADGGDTTVILSDSCTTDSDRAGECLDACDFNVSPMIDVTKRCVTRLVAEDGVVKVAVQFAGSVTNTSDQTSAPVPLKDVAVADDKAGGPLELFDAEGSSLGTSTRLEPGETAFFNNSYLPDSVNDTCPSNATFMDTVTASGVDIFQGISVEDMATATCDLCPQDGCEDL